ncbi:MAG: hypothetical protein M3T56_09135 [Chloroflexota bacterium]|nr:hypothetical protein [Chloroflexota bacterium]
MTLTKPTSGLRTSLTTPEYGSASWLERRAWLHGSREALVVVDEPSAGLSPVLVQAVFRALREIHAAGTTILLVEQNVPLSLRLAQRAYVIELGRVILQGTGAEILANPHVQAAYLGRA